MQQEVFLRFSYVQPALRATQPSRVRLKIAPIDIIYSQACPWKPAVVAASDSRPPYHADNTATWQRPC